MIEKSKVYIIGAGPGDPELISVKGLKTLRKADCVLYDFLSAPALLKETKRSCEKICVGKSDGFRLKEQRQINRLLYEKSMQYRVVVRLKGGDPFVFSRGYEEASYLKRKMVDCEVIPGITSALAAPASIGIPLTIKNRISSIAIVTGRKHDPDAPIDVPRCGTIIYLMAVANIAKVVEALLENGYSRHTPCAFIEKATCSHQRQLISTIGRIEKKARVMKIRPPAVFVVGDVVKKRVKNDK